MCEYKDSSAQGRKKEGAGNVGVNLTGMKGVRMTIQELKASKVAAINQDTLNDLQWGKGKKKPAPQVLWMWGQLVAWSLSSGIQVVQEHRFHPERKWRFDFALPDKNIGIEYEGLNSEKSGHTTLNGYTKDTEKYNEAQALGWDVIRFTVKNYKKVIETLEKHLGL